MRQVWRGYAKLAASLVNIAILAASLVTRTPTWRIFGSAIPAALFWQRQITNALTNAPTDTTSALLALLPKTHR